MILHIFQCANASTYFYNPMTSKITFHQHVYSLFALPSFTFDLLSTQIRRVKGKCFKEKYFTCNFLLNFMFGRIRIEKKASQIPQSSWKMARQAAKMDAVRTISQIIRYKTSFFSSSSLFEGKKEEKENGKNSSNNLKCGARVAHGKCI